VSDGVVMTIPGPSLAILFSHFGFIVHCRQTDRLNHTQNHRCGLITQWIWRILKS